MDKELFMKLVTAKSEKDIDYLLSTEKFFKHDVKWLPYGGNESNFSVINNQQPDPVNALVEKPINSIDAVLTKECWKRGIDPKGSSAPCSMKAAIEKFFGIPGGDLSAISNERRRELAKNIMIIAEGDFKRPTIVVVDNGEGQPPSAFKDTLLSLLGTNKINIPFVQGKYNMGSTGVLPFCGTKCYQLILSRVNPELNGVKGEDDRWGITLVREKPNVDERSKSVYYEYFTDTSDEIYTLPPEPLKILPDGQEFNGGCYVKMFDYQLPSPSIITTTLYQQMSRRLFEAGLPMLLVETREFGGRTRSSTLYGNGFIVKRERGDIKKTFTISSDFYGFGKVAIEVTVFKHRSELGEKVADKRGFTDTKEIIFLTQNGQTHHSIGRSTFKTKTDLLSIADYVMIHVDMTSIPRNKAKMFMGSRDRVRGNDDYREFEDEFFDDLKNNRTLQQINEEYRQLDLQAIVPEAEFNDLLRKVIENNPHLLNVLPYGDSASNPIGKTIIVSKPFTPSYIPTYLRVQGHYDSDSCIRGLRDDGKPAYLVLRTDAPDDYLEREEDRGELKVESSSTILYTLHNLDKGRIPIKVGPRDKIEYDKPELTFTLTRPNDTPLVEKIVFYYYTPKKDGTKRKRKRKEDIPGLRFPQLQKVTREKWPERGWDENNIAEVEPDAIWINIDSKVLKDFLATKPSRQHDRIIRGYLLNIYIHSLVQYYELKDDEDYDKRFAKSIRAVAKAVLSFDTLNEKLLEVLQV